jgi:hypothetical protein
MLSIKIATVANIFLFGEEVMLVAINMLVLTIIKRKSKTLLWQL